jgi:hypothetical protein
MEFVSILRDLWQRRLIVAVLIVLGVVAALAVNYKLPSFEKRSLELGSASSQILVDSPESTLVEGAESNSLAILSTRARIYAQYLSSPEARASIAKKAGLSPAQLSAKGPFSTEAGTRNYDPQPAEVRAGDISDEKSGYRLVFTAQEDVPIITVSAQAPSAAEAISIAEASFTTLSRYVSKLQAGVVRNGSPATDALVSDRGVVVRELGRPEGGTLGGGNNLMMMIFAFAAIVGLGCVAIPVIQGVVRYWRLLDQAERWTAPETPQDGERPHGDESRNRVDPEPHDDIGWIERHRLTPSADADVAVERTAGQG